MTFARSVSGELALAYLPDNDGIVSEAAVIPRVTRVRWFNPRTGGFVAVAPVAPVTKRMAFLRPARGEWVLVLQAQSAQTSSSTAPAPSQIAIP